MKIYLAGPMRGYHQFNFPAFDAAALALRLKGHQVISPAELDRARGFNEKTDNVDDAFIRDAIARDLQAIIECDAIAMLPGWQQSSGAKLEKSLADFLKLKVLDATTGEPLADEPITAEAHRITNRDRRDVYGHPADDFARIAGMWSALLGVKVTAQLVASCMVCVKLGRLVQSPSHRDSMVDIAGYANCMDMIRQRKAGT